jgi:hypothetical protein
MSTACPREKPFENIPLLRRNIGLSVQGNVHEYASKWYKPKKVMKNTGLRPNEHAAPALSVPLGAVAS